MQHKVKVNEEQAPAEILVRDNGEQNVLMHFRWGLDQPEPELWVWGFASRADYHLFAKMVHAADVDLCGTTTQAAFLRDEIVRLISAEIERSGAELPASCEVTDDGRLMVIDSDANCFRVTVEQV